MAEITDILQTRAGKRQRKMKTIIPVTAATPVATHAKTANAPNWQAGQLLQGKVMQEQGAEKFLRIGRHDFSARGLEKLPAGQTLKLEVLRGGELPVLRLLQNNPAEKLVTRQRLLDLPRQTSLLQLTSLLSTDRLEKSALPADLKAAAVQLLASLPRATQAQQPATLKTLLKLSGLFLEHQLGQQAIGVESASLQSDLKAILLVYRNELRRLLSTNKPAMRQTPAGNTPPPDRRAFPVAHKLAVQNDSLQPQELLDTLESTLARQRLNQLESLPRENDLSRVWLMEIPLVEKENIDLLQLRIEQKKSGQETESDETWTIELAISPEPLGPVHARLQLAGEILSLKLWLEEPRTEKIFQRHLDRLQSHLRACGINTSEIQIFPGAPPQPKRSGARPSLLEQQA